MLQRQCEIRLEARMARIACHGRFEVFNCNTELLSLCKCEPKLVVEIDKLRLQCNCASQDLDGTILVASLQQRHAKLDERLYVARIDPQRIVERAHGRVQIALMSIQQPQAIMKVRLM